MKNIVTNQHGVFTYRKSVKGSSVRVSLQTKDKLEAIQLAQSLATYVDLIDSKSPEVIKSIINAALIKLQPTFKQNRINRIQQALGIELIADEGEPISVIAECFVQEKLRAKAWTEKTYASYKTIFFTLPDFVGDKGIKTFTHSDAQNIKSCIQRLPSSMNKRAEYRDKSIKQILKMSVPNEHLMSIKTVNTRLSCYSEMFKWAMKNGYVDKNVFDGLSLKDTRNAKDLRLPFSPNDLKELFSSKQLTQPSNDWQRWLPVLALFTGARLNELCQLDVKDIKQIGDCWCISITDKGINQHLKSASSRRIIPIHHLLIELGFLDFVKQQSNGNIFKQLKLINGRYAHTPSKWFGSVKQNVLRDSTKKTFHSFRHTFIDYLFNGLKLQGNPLVKALVGHSDKEITSGIYGSSFDIRDLNAIIQRIDFSEYGVCFKTLGYASTTS
ncbi:site-specific integrase [Glaciecola sp. KUL10]|uniref:site-specific integrase n=1 Tax=Glaciecola sp. (strain KUL10) TaxID=2161813 RepID=UPI000D789F4A|nr:site-specific integrase [Glaciecola sp. KUL10]GBL04927.1 Integrase family protein [Glaciecola sp. KUL10]